MEDLSGAVRRKKQIAVGMERKHPPVCQRAGRNVQRLPALSLIYRSPGVEECFAGSIVVVKTIECAVRRQLHIICATGDGACGKVSVQPACSAIKGIAKRILPKRKYSAFRADVLNAGNRNQILTWHIQFFPVLPLIGRNRPAGVRATGHVQAALPVLHDFLYFRVPESRLQIFPADAQIVGTGKRLFGTVVTVIVQLICFIQKGVLWDTDTFILSRLSVPAGSVVLAEIDFIVIGIDIRPVICVKNQGGDFAAGAVYAYLKPIDTPIDRAEQVAAPIQAPGHTGSRVVFEFGNWAADTVGEGYGSQLARAVEMVHAFQPDIHQAVIIVPNTKVVDRRTRHLHVGEYLGEVCPGVFRYPGGAAACVGP